MILSRFFKPKWQHPDPEIRKHYIHGLAACDPVLMEIARQDREPEVRCAAIAKLSELSLLRQIAGQEPSEKVRECAAARLQELLAGQASDSPPLPVRLAALPALGASHLEHLAVHGREAELRLAALQQIDNETLLAEVVINDPVAEVRFAALERVHELATLEHIAKLDRHRDKRISCQVRERLESLRADKQRVERIERLCAELEALTWDGENGLSAARFPKLEREWQELESAADAERRERYSRARARFLGERQESIAKRLAKQDICVALEKCLATLQAAVELTDEVNELLAHPLQDAQERWQQIGAASDHDARRLEQRFSQLLHALHEQERLLQRDHERAGRLRALLSQADALLHQPSEVLESDLSALKQRWSSLERPESKELTLALQNQFDALLDRLKNRLQRQHEQRDQELAELQELVNSLESALEEGELQHAIALHEQARKRLRHNISLSRQQMAVLEQRLQACVPQLNELRGWRRWGTDQAREHLCEEAERLIGLSADPESIAQQLKNLRAAWRALSSTETGAVAKALWKRFDSACEKAYAPCQAYFAAQAQERQNNLAKKQALCERLEQFEATTDWELADWKLADRLQREVQNHWHKIAAVPRAQEKALERRYSEVLKHFDTHLQAERNRELRRRRALIERMQALINADDTASAVEAAKQAQAEWSPTVQASRREEQALWRKFRAACDSVFERRKAEQAAAEQQRQANVARKTTLCEEIEALASADREAIMQARQQVQQARQDWATLGPVPRAVYRALEQRFEAACKRFAHHEQALQETGLRAQLQDLRQRALLCARLEALLVEQDPALEAATLAQVRQEWEALGEPQSAWAEPSKRRFDTACQALLEGGETRQSVLQTLQANVDRKQLLCLRLEILAGIDSPEEWAEARMQYQVSRLAESLHGANKRKSAEEARDIEMEWYSLGLLPPEQNELLEARFQRALNVLGRKG